MGDFFINFIKSVGFSDEVRSIVKKYAKGDEETEKQCFKELADTVANLPSKFEYKIETSDNALSFNGLSLTFIRDWEKGEAIIMTNAEAAALDEHLEINKGTVIYVDFNKFKM